MSERSAELGQIYKDHAKDVFKYLMSLTGNPDLSEELTQETFYRAVYSINKYDGTCKITVWLCQIAKHIWYQELEKRKRCRTEPLNEEMVCSGLNPEEQILATDNKAALYKAIHSLPENMREVVHMRLTGEFSFMEIGEILGKNENWARVTFYRAKQKIMEVF